MSIQKNLRVCESLLRNVLAQVGMFQHARLGYQPTATEILGLWEDLGMALDMIMPRADVPGPTNLAQAIQFARDSLKAAADVRPRYKANLMRAVRHLRAAIEHCVELAEAFER